MLESEGVGIDVPLLPFPSSFLTPSLFKKWDVIPAGSLALPLRSPSPPWSTSHLLFIWIYSPHPHSQPLILINPSIHINTILWVSSLLPACIFKTWETGKKKTFFKVGLLTMWAEVCYIKHPTLVYCLMRYLMKSRLIFSCLSTFVYLWGLFFGFAYFFLGHNAEIYIWNTVVKGLFCALPLVWEELMLE